MRVEGVDLAGLADRVGTPLYCYSAAAISSAYRRWWEAFAGVGFDGARHRTCFAVKANSALAVLRHLVAAGAGFDVVSGGELHRVMKAGGDARQVVFSGPGKSPDELRQAVEAGVGLINVEVRAGVEAVWDLVGPLCETGDVLARGVSLGGVEVGTLLAVRDSGAYGFVMSSEYKAHPRPAKVWVEGHRWATITPRDSPDEMLRGEQMAPWQVRPGTDGDC